MASDSGDSSRVQINLRVNESTKREWVEHVDESNHFSTLTDLVKTAVSRTIDSEWVLEDHVEVSNTADPGAEPPVPEALSESIEDIDDRLEALQTQLDAAALSNNPPEDQGGEAENMPEHELRQFSFELHDLLPQVRSEDQLMQLTPLHRVTEDPKTRAMLTGTAQDISAVVDKPEPVVRRGLIYLVNENGNKVESCINDGVRRFYDVDPSVPAGIETWVNDSLDVDNMPGINTAEDALELVPASDIRPPENDGDF